VWNGFTIYAQTVKEVCGKFGRGVALNYEALLIKIIDQDRRDLTYVLRSRAFRDMSWKKQLSILGRGLLSSYRRSLFHYLPSDVRSRVIRNQPFFSRLTHHRNVADVAECMELLANLHRAFLMNEFLELGMAGKKF
jgi:hypothetical protein